MKRILILYSEISVYTQECLNDYLSFYSNVKVSLIRWPINTEAPFNLIWHKNISIINKSDVNLLAYLREFNPNLILCSGWIDKDYIDVLSKIKTTDHIPEQPQINNRQHNRRNVKKKCCL